MSAKKLTLYFLFQDDKSTSIYLNYFSIYFKRFSRTKADPKKLFRSAFLLSAVYPESLWCEFIDKQAGCYDIHHTENNGKDTEKKCGNV